jgi:4-hydroxy-4-methyl-2-oxoglutarate aldolase
MRILFALAALFPIFPATANAQVFTFTKEQMLQYTSKNPFERFEDGRPKVPDALLEKVRALAAEDIFGVLNQTYPNQFEGGFRILHPGKKLVGRAVTAQFMPARPDVGDVIEEDAKKRNAGRQHNQRVIDMLQPGDVVVVDLFGKVEGGTFVGDNLAMAVFGKTKQGMVIDGSIRDLEGIFEIPMQAYFRNVHPSAIRNVMLTAVNTPIRIGGATVMPGDVVFGDREGIYFIPPHLVQQIVTRADATKIHDEWTKAKFMTGKYKSSELYPSPTIPELKKEYEEYLKKKLAELK